MERLKKKKHVRREKPKTKEKFTKQILHEKVEKERSSRREKVKKKKIIVRKIKIYALYIERIKKKKKVGDFKKLKTGLVRKGEEI